MPKSPTSEAFVKRLCGHKSKTGVVNSRGKHKEEEGVTGGQARNQQEQNVVSKQAKRSNTEVEDVKKAALLTTMAAAIATTSSGNREESKDGQNEGISPPPVRKTSHNEDPHLRNSGKDSQFYGWWNTLNGDVDDVGQLRVHLVGASGLYGADFGGKSDPFCTVKLGDLEYRSEVSRKTLEPEWKEQFHFDVRDMSEVLYVCVYDHDRFHDPEFLGCVAVPLLAMSAGKEEEDSHGERVFALKDKKMDKRAKGKHPRIRLKFELDWNLPRACVKTIRTPAKKDLPPFKRSLLISNVQRVRKILHFASSVGQYIQSCFNWEKPARSIRAFLAYELLVYCFEPFMFPLILLAFMVFIYPLYACDIVNDWLDPYYELAVDDDDDDDEKEDEKPDKRASGLRYKAITEVTAFVQNSLGQLASMVERAKNVFTFSEPFMSWIAAAVLTAATILLYFVPVRTLLMLWGVHKFSKKILRPNHVPSSELLNFLSRVPDDPALDRSRLLSVMDERLLKEEEERRANKEKRPVAKMRKKVSEFFARHSDRDREDGHDESGDESLSREGSRSSLLSKVKEEVQERPRDSSTLFSRDSSRLSGIFYRSSKGKSPPAPFIPDQLERPVKSEEKEKRTLIKVNVSKNEEVTTLESAFQVASPILASMAMEGGREDKRDAKRENDENSDDEGDLTPRPVRRSPPPRPPPPKYKLPSK